MSEEKLSKRRPSGKVTNGHRETYTNVHLRKARPRKKTRQFRLVDGTVFEAASVRTGYDLTLGITIILESRNGREKVIATYKDSRSGESVKEFLRVLKEKIAEDSEEICHIRDMPKSPRIRLT